MGPEMNASPVSSQVMLMLLVGPLKTVLYGTIFSSIFILNAINTLYSLPLSLEPLAAGETGKETGPAFEQSQKAPGNPSSYPVQGAFHCISCFLQSLGRPLCGIQGRGLSSQSWVEARLTKSSCRKTSFSSGEERMCGDGLFINKLYPKQCH